MTVSKFLEAVRADLAAFVDMLASATGRDSPEERDAWEASLPAFADALANPALAQMHLYFGGHGYVALEYQLPAASSWCDVVLLGRSKTQPSAVIVELKHWITRADEPGPVEGLMRRGSELVLHPSDQVRGYARYCRRFHSTVLETGAKVLGCVLFTRDHFIARYAEPPNDELVRDYPCFTVAPNMVREAWTPYLVEALQLPDEEFARAFVKGRYRQDRAFARQVGTIIRERRTSASCRESPFELLDHQRRALAVVRAVLEKDVLASPMPRKQVILIEGPPGSGKSVVAAHIWAELVTDNRLPNGSVVLTTTSTAQTSNWAKFFEGEAEAAAGFIKRATSYVPVTTHALGQLRRRYGKDFARDPLDWRRNVQLLRDRGIPFQEGARDEQYLVSIVDEAHALINPEYPEGRGQFGFAIAFGPLAWHIIRCSTVSVFLLDGEQGFRDRENTRLEDIRRWAAELGAEVHEPISLAGAQFRCGGSVEYVAWVDGLLGGRPERELAALAQKWRSAFDVRVFENPARLESALREKARSRETVRLVASYAREWKTRDAVRPHALPPGEMDFHEPYVDEKGERRYWSKPWNFVPQNGQDYTWFIQAPPGSPMRADPLCEVGCPYVVRGFDFDRVGVLWLSDLVWRCDRWKADPSHVHDTGLPQSVRAALRERTPASGHERLRAALARAYRILLTRGMSGCYLWIEDEETRNHVLSSLGCGADARIE